MNYHDTVKTFDEFTSQFLYHTYCTQRKALRLDINLLTTNCNGYVLNKFDKSETSGKVSCIPYNVLKDLLKEKGIDAVLDNVEGKKSALKKVKEFYTEKYLLDKFHIFYKPCIDKKPIEAVPWEFLSHRGNALEPVAEHNLEQLNNESSWLSNIELLNLMKRFTIIKQGCIYIGTFLVNKFDPLTNSIYLKDALKESGILIKFKEYMESDNQYIMGHVICKAHWSSIIVDKCNKRILYYCSGGNPPDSFPACKFNFYSTKTSFIKSSSSRTTCKYGVVIQYNLLKLLSDEFNLDVYVNVEASQKLNGECGMFSAMFLLLYCTDTIESNPEIESLYNSYRFMGDKIMTMYRNLLFWTGPMKLESQKIPSEHITDWKSVLAKISSIADRVTRGIVSEFTHLVKLYPN